MKSTSLLLAPLTIACAALFNNCLAAEADARSTIAHVWQRYQAGAQSEQELIEVQVRQGAQVLPAKLLWRRIRYGEQGQHVSVKFVEPIADLGLALLIERNTNGTDQIWLRLPSWTSARKVVGSRETRYFADTAFTFEDNKQLIGEQTSLFDYRYQSTDPNATVISATPRAGTVSGYARRDISLNGQGVPTRIDYLDENAQILKTLTFEELNVAAAGRWRADRVTLKQRDGSQTTLKVRKRTFNDHLPERVFSQAAMLENDSASSH